LESFGFYFHGKQSNNDLEPYSQIITIE